MTREEAFDRLHTVIATGREKVDDKTASIAPELYGTLQEDGLLISQGTRINWSGILKKAAVDLWDRPENNPDNAPALWVDILYRNGYRMIPEIITVTEAFEEGECGWWNGELYRSKVNANVFTPAVYPDHWELVK